jgi:hypothetical protein
MREARGQHPDRFQKFVVKVAGGFHEAGSMRKMFTAQSYLTRRRPVTQAEAAARGKRMI